ncbi:hypothetical protein, partial [Hungatella effluvii]|uniref:hypothetical protein n=1 Tax=Hungatella effluvii TaxID=1096246 RepID=UPI002A8368EE
RSSNRSSNNSSNRSSNRSNNRSSNTPATHQQQQNKSKYTATELTIESWRDCQRVKREATGPKRKEYSV